MELWYDPTFAAAVAAAVAAALWLLWRCRRAAEGRCNLPPGSLGFPVIGETLHLLAHAWRNQPHEFAENRHRRYGEAFKTHIFGKPTVFLTGAKASKTFFTVGRDVFDAAHVGNMEEIIGKRSIISVRGEEHKRMRRITNEVFSAESMRTYVERVEEVAKETFAGWRAGEVYSMKEAAIQFTFNIIIRILLSWTPNSKTERIQKLSVAMTKGILSLPIRLPGFAFNTSWKARNELIDIFKEEIKRRKGLTEFDDMPDDLMSKMLMVKDSVTGVAMLNEDDIAHNMLAFITAGHDSSVSTMLFIIKYLDENPQAQQMLRAEYEEIEQKKNGSNVSLTWSDVKQMNFTEKVISESSRLANIVYWLSRVAKQDYQMEGYTIPKGWMVMLNVYHMHMSEENFNDAKKFNPLRFDEVPKSYSFVPFAMGDRICVGRELAKMELTIFLYQLLSNFRWKRDTCDMGIDHSGISKPKGDVSIKILEMLK